MNENLTSYEIQKITQIFDKVEIIDKKKTISKRNKNYIKWFLIILFFCITLIWIWFYIYVNSLNNTKNAEIFWLFFFWVVILFIILNLILFLKKWLTWEANNSWKSQYDYLDEKINKFIYPLISASYSHFNYRWIKWFLNRTWIFNLNSINFDNLCNNTFYNIKLDYDQKNNEEYINTVLENNTPISQNNKQNLFGYFNNFFFPLWVIIQKLIKNKLIYKFYWSYFTNLATFNIKDSTLWEKKVFFNTSSYSSSFEESQNFVTSNFHIIDEKYNFWAPISITNKLEDKLKNIYADFYVSIFYVSIFFYIAIIPVISLYLWSFLLKLNFVNLFFDKLNNFYFSYTNSILISTEHYMNFMYVLFIITWYYLFYRLLKSIPLERFFKEYYPKIKKIDLNDFHSIFEIKTTSREYFDMINNNYGFKKMLVEYYKKNKKNTRFYFTDWSLNIFITNNLDLRYPWYKNEKNNINFYVNKITDYRKSIKFVENIHNSFR